MAGGATLIALLGKAVLLCSVYSVTSSDSVSLCPEGKFANAALICVPECPSGYYGDTPTGTCQKCSSNCKTCLNGDENDRCSSCNPPLYLKEASCVQTCGEYLTKGPPETEIRLLGGSNHLEGRVEIKHDGIWGTVCDDLWDISDADVVCRELLLGKAQEAVSFGRLGRGQVSQPIWLSKVECIGKETRLERCPHHGWGNHSCSHFEDAGVRCKGPDTTRECVSSCGDGYFLEKGNGKCSVCSPSCLTCEGSSTVCTSCDAFRFRKGASCVTSCGQGFYGDTSDRHCKPCDPGCYTCADGTLSTTCTTCPDDRYLKGDECVVSCAPSLVGQRRRMRLVGINSSELEGRLEVFVKGAWSTVCDKTFNFPEASVACRQLGLGSAVKAVKKTVYGPGSGPIWSSDVKCTGRELSLFECKTKPRERSGCYHSSDVGVVCSGPLRGEPQINQCLKRCNSGWYKNDFDVCSLCASQCAECSGNGFRCTRCKEPKFLKDNTCVDKCSDGEYGHIPSRECRKCNTEKCVKCADGNDENDCMSCKPPKALKNGTCVEGCGPDMYHKSGVCALKCGDLFYQFAGNYSCLPCPSDCLQCVYNSAKGLPQCTVCAPPLVFDNNVCRTNCSGSKVAVPIRTLNDSSSNSALVRLSNGSDYLEGVLEIFHDGVWGTVCDDGWDAKETSVVCRELGLGTADTTASLRHIPKQSREAQGKLWLDDVFCRGNEKSLHECRHSPWGRTNCGHDEDAVLRCTGPGILKCQQKCPAKFYEKDKVCFPCSISCNSCDGSPNKCKTCTTGYFEKNETCVTDCGRGLYPAGNTCLKCDPSCDSCDMTPGNCTLCPDRKYKKDSKCVTDCRPGFKPTSKPFVRLAGEHVSPFEGRVEIYHGGKYGSICDDFWDIKDATVVCRMLGMGNATAAVKRAKYGSLENGPVWMDDVNCTGNELSLIDCGFNGWGNEDCTHSEDAGVVCQRPDNTRDCLSTCDLNNGYFLDESNGCGKCSSECKTCSGTPENCTTCPPNTFLNMTGNMTFNCASSCIERYFPDPLTKHCMPCDTECHDCQGRKDNCTACEGKFLQSSKCVDRCSENQITLKGVTDIRLAGANSTVEGRVEVLYDGIWGTICDDSFDIMDAKVICRQLKLGKAVEALGRAKYGMGIGQIWIDDLQCVGTERNILDCNMKAGGIGSHNCRHSEDAGVKCSGPDMSKKCVTSCGAGFFKGKNKECERCAVKCKTCNGSASSCTSCDPPHFYISSDCVRKCPLGLYGDTKDRLCKPCDKVCQTCSDGETGDKCRSCPNGLFLNGSACVKDCGDLRSVSSLFLPKTSEPVVRLVNKKGNKGQGRVEVLYEGVWGTVCDDGWDMNDANVVCKELGFGKAKEATKHSSFGKGIGIIWMDNVNCLGYESSLTHCRHVGWGEGNCDPNHAEDAGVICDNTTVEELSNNFCREVNDGSCADLKLCDSHAGVTCVDLDLYNQKGEEESVCMRCPNGYTGDGQKCRVIASNPPIFDKKPIKLENVKFQDAFSLQCSSLPPVVYPSAWDWRRDGKPLSVDDIRSRRITSKSGTLVVRSAVAEDTGNYTCVLVNSAGSVESDPVMVVVEVPPQIPGVVSADVTEGKDAILACLVSSSPPSNITWRYKDKIIGSDNSKFNVNDRNFSLQIKDVTFEDAGDYECEAMNELGSAVAYAKLEVGLTLKYTNFISEAKVKKRGQDVTLPCVVRARPLPNMAWKKDGVLVTNDDRHVVTQKELTIRKLTSTDMGRYYCIAWNKRSVQAREALLFVTGPPIIDMSPEDQDVLSGANVSLYCGGYGDPPPKIIWQKNSVNVETSGRIKIDPVQGSGELQIISVTVEDAGKYECIYKNSFGEDRREASLTVDGQTGTESKTKASKGLSTGAVVGIVIALALVSLLVIVAVILKCRKTSYYRGDKLMMSKPTRFSDLKTKVVSSFGKETRADPLEEEDIDL